MLIADFGVEAAGPALSHLEDYAIPLRSSRIASSDSGYRSLPGPTSPSSDDNTSILHNPDPHMIPLQTVPPLKPKSPNTALEAREAKKRGGAESDESAAKSPAATLDMDGKEQGQDEFAAAATAGSEKTRKTLSKRKKMNKEDGGVQIQPSLIERRGTTVLVSDVVADGKLTRVRETGKAAIISAPTAADEGQGEGQSQGQKILKMVKKWNFV